MVAEVDDFLARKNISTAKGLLQALVPRAQFFCFYDLERNCIWSSNGTDDFELNNFVSDLPDVILKGTDSQSTEIGIWSIH